MDAIQSEIKQELDKDLMEYWLFGIRLGHNTQIEIEKGILLDYFFENGFEKKILEYSLLD